MIQWWLNEPLGAGDDGTVTFDAQVPTGYISGGGDPFIENCAGAQLGTGAAMKDDCQSTIVEGTNSIGDLVWADNGAGTGGIAANGVQDGTEAGINLITVTLYWDKNGDGNLDEDDVLVETQETDVSGGYDFTDLPDGDYIVVVDTADSDLPVGYGPTTQKEYAVSVSGSQDYNDADFGFGPALVVSKNLISDNPAYEADTVTFRIDLTNALPGDGTASGFCKYTIWASIAHLDGTNSPPGGGSLLKQWANVNNALFARDFAYTTTDLEDAAELLGLSGFNTGDQGGTITDVELVIYFQEQEDFISGSELIVRTWDDNVTGEVLDTYTYDDVYFSGGVGTIYVINQNVFDDRASWDWSHFSANTTELQLEGNKGSGSDGGEIAVDAVAYVVTTDQTCGGADSTIVTLPMNDTYDADLLSFVSADPAHTTNTTSGYAPQYGWDHYLGKPGTAVRRWDQVHHSDLYRAGPGCWGYDYQHRQRYGRRVWQRPSGQR